MTPDCTCGHKLGAWTSKTSEGTFVDLVPSAINEMNNAKNLVEAMNETLFNSCECVDSQICEKCEFIKLETRKDSKTGEEYKVGVLRKIPIRENRKKEV